MRLTRIYVPDRLQAPGVAQVGGSAAAHLSRVLRLRRGAVVTLFNGDGFDYAAAVAAVRGTLVELEIVARAPGTPPSPLRLTLVQGVSRGERMDVVVQKATELGIQRIVPVLAERSVVRLDAARAQQKRQHWQAVAIAACEQCGRSLLPEVEQPLDLGDWLRSDHGPGARLLLAPGAPRGLRDLPADTAAATLLIGPEGGFSDDEQALATASGFEACSLGPRVLRTETAAIAAIVVLQSICGDLR